MLSPITEWFARVSYDPTTGRPNTEPPQAVIRVAAALVFLGVLCADAYFNGPHPTALVPPPMLVALGGWSLLVAIVVLAHTIHYRRPSGRRRALAITHDYLFVAILMLLGGEPVSFGLLFITWLTIGNGLRYGPRALQYSLPAACASFAVPAIFSPFWAQHPALVFTGFGLILIPTIYAFVLLRAAANASEAMERASRARTILQREVSSQVLRPLEGLSDLAQTGSLAAAPSLVAWEARVLAHLHRTASLLSDPLRNAPAARSTHARPIPSVEAFMDPVRDLAKALARTLIARVEPGLWRGALIHPDRVVQLHVHAALVVATSPTPGPLLLEHHFLSRHEDTLRLLVRMGVVGESPDRTDDPLNQVRFQRLRSLASELGGTARWEGGLSGHVVAVEIQVSIARVELPEAPLVPASRVLIHEPRPHILRRLIAHLEGQGHVIIERGNAEQPDVVLLCPDEIRAASCYPGARCVVLLDEEDSALELAAAMNGLDWVIGAQLDASLLDRLFSDIPPPLGIHATDLSRAHA